MEQQSKKLGRRVLLFPLPFQGHATPMLHLAAFLHQKGFSITIIQSHYNPLNPTDFPHFKFHFIDDSLSDITTRSALHSDLALLLAELNTRCSEPFRNCLSSILSGARGDEPVACIIADPLWRFVGTVANGFNLPRIALRTGSLSAYVVYDTLPLLREKGYFPLQEMKLEEPVPELPPFKVKDLPPESEHALVSPVVIETKNSQGLISNTFEELEGSALAKVKLDIPSIPVFSLGPLHRLSRKTSVNNLWTQDKTSISWLNTQAPRSVLYVSFGSIASISKTEFLEIAWGLANSRQPFLWVVRPGWVQDSESSEPVLPEGYLDAVGTRGYIVKWAPQQDVLAHPAVSGFWTHCGWNSTMESVCEGVPMICQPCFADQPINARQVSDSWRVGLMLEKGMRNRKEIQKVVRRLMVEEEGDEMRNRAAALKEKARLCLMEGGSSYISSENLTSYLLQ